ncbi:MAG: hypothetical protein ACRC41_00930 [Sarcina sp.]
MENQFFLKSDIQSNISDIETILSSNILNIKNPTLQKGAFIHMLILLRDLMFKSEKYATKVNFTDDVITNAKIKDVSDLIIFVRNALCHPDSSNNYLINDNIKATYNVIYGKGTFMKIDDITIASDYDDDICFLFGPQKIYLKRHILRAFEEAKTNLKDFL